MPARSFFVDVLVAWTKNEDVALAAERADGVLRRMLELSFGEGYGTLLPDIRTFDKVILAWSRSRLPSGPDHINHLLTEMDRLQTLKIGSFTPTIVTHTNHMLAYLRSSRSDASNQIQTIFDHLLERCSNGERDLCPDCYVYGILIDAWGQEKDTQKVEQIFLNMLSTWKSGNSSARPDSDVFLKILKVLSLVSADKCQQYVGMMQDIGLPLTLEAYSYVLKALNVQGSLGEIKARKKEVIDDIMDGVAVGRIERPKLKEHRAFLQLVADCEDRNLTTTIVADTQRDD